MAVRRLTLGEDGRFVRGSQLAVDGKFEPEKTSYMCDKLDNEKKVWMVDMMETVKVVALRISTHIDTKSASRIEVCTNDSIVMNIKILNPDPPA